MAGVTPYPFQGDTRGFEQNMGETRDLGLEFRGLQRGRAFSALTQVEGLLETEFHILIFIPVGPMRHIEQLQSPGWWRGDAGGSYSPQAAAGSKRGGRRAS